jgi:uncharacterized protein YfaP (DUF2135 family)
LRVTLERPDAFRSVHPGGASVPAWVAGAIAGAGGRQLTLALSVNGVIQGVVPTDASGDEARFGGLVPPSAFRPGANDVRVYAIDSRGRALSTILTSRDG